MDGASPTQGTRYDADFMRWAREQAALIRAGDWQAVDWANVAGEIEGLGNSDLAQLESRLIVLIAHLLKRDHALAREPERQWELTIREQRRAIARLLRRMPSLRTRLTEIIPQLYTDARIEAMDAFELFEPERVAEYDASLPKTCPYDEADMLQ